MERVMEAQRAAKVATPTSGDFAEQKVLWMGKPGMYFEQWQKQMVEA